MRGPGEAYLSAEDRARVEIDQLLVGAGWLIQNTDRVNLGGGQGVAVREFVLRKPHGRADYLLFVDRQAVGAIEAKPQGSTLTEVEVQTAKYVDGLPYGVKAPVAPLPFRYESTGSETRFTNAGDPIPRSRRLFDGNFHRPETLAAWIGQMSAVPQTGTLRSRIAQLPPIDDTNLWPAQRQAITNLESSLRANRQRALIQMATGSGKTYTAATLAYRLIEFAHARRILFMVDRSTSVGRLGASSNGSQSQEQAANLLRSSTSSMSSATPSIR